MLTNIDEASVIQANALFWEQMLAMRLEPLYMAGEFCVDAGHVLASVQMSGAWVGRMEVRLSIELAATATAAMLMQPVEEVGAADTLDAVKEIANMIAGTLKSSLPRPCAMTVPQSSLELARFCGPPQTGDSLVVAFRHPSGEMMVRVCEEAMAGNC